MTDDPEFSDTELALIDAIRTIFDIMIANGLKPEQADRILELHQERWERNKRPKAASSLGLLRKLTTSKDREQTQVAELLRKAKTQGSA